MSSFPFLQMLLLLLALHAPRTQGWPLTTRKYQNEFKELEDILSKTPLPSQKHVGSNDQSILKDTNLLKPNLDVFLNSSMDFQDKGHKIRKNLQQFREDLPVSTSTEDPVSIEKDNWDDFWRKITEYLKHLKDFFNSSKPKLSTA